MKHARFSFLLGFLVSVLFVVNAFAASQAQWKVVIPQKLFAEKLRIAAFHNADFGFIGGAGDIGKAKFTTDGGKSWIQAESSGG